MCSAGGIPYPERYEHADGGLYRGQWAGSIKQGVGVYRYPGGSRYEGEWHANLKNGHGIFTFAKVMLRLSLSVSGKTHCSRVQGILRVYPGSRYTSR